MILRARWSRRLGLLWSLRDQSALDAFVRARLQAVIEHDARRGSEFMLTLRAYCAHAGRRGDTARALHIERQTLYYRLGRIESLIGSKLTDGDALLAIHLALRAQPYLSPVPASTDQPMPPMTETSWTNGARQATRDARRRSSGPDQNGSAADSRATVRRW